MSDEIFSQMLEKVQAKAQNANTTAEKKKLFIIA